MGSIKKKIGKDNLGRLKMGRLKFELFDIVKVLMRNSHIIILFISYYIELYKIYIK